MSKVNVPNENQMLRTVRKITFLASSAVALLINIIMIFIPFVSYTAPAQFLAQPKKLSPILFAELMNDSTALKNSVAYVMLGIFIVTVISAVIATVFFIRLIISFFKDESKMSEMAKSVLITVTSLTGVWFLGSFIAAAVSQMNRKTVTSVNHIGWLIVMILLDIAVAVLIGMMKSEGSERPNKKFKEEYLKNKRKLLIAKIEMFVYTLAASCLSVIALLTKVLSINMSVQGASNQYNMTVTLSGWDIIQDPTMLGKGSQVARFLLFAMVVVVCAMLFMTILSFAGRSAAFFKISVYTVGIGGVCSLGVGLLGKYYQIVQAMNDNFMLRFLNQNFGVSHGLELDYVMTVKSTSWYFFLGVCAVIGLILLRNPYTRGIKAENIIGAIENGTHTSTARRSGVRIPEKRDFSDGAAVSPSASSGDPCPAFTELDSMIPEFEEELSERQVAEFEDPTLPKIVQFVVNYARDSRLHLSYTNEDIAAFLAGLGTTRLSILQGMSGTGKTSLPKIFNEAIMGRCDIIEVESSWRDKSELIGYYNEFSKTFTPKKFTQALYRAILNPDVVTCIVLDEMNLSRIEYYFSDFLSLMENEEDRRELKLLNVPIYRTDDEGVSEYSGLERGHTMRIPPNVWFIGTANRDESTFEISDKVYDRAHTMNFNKRAPKVLYYNDPIEARYISPETLVSLFEEAHRTVNFNIESYSPVTEVEKLLEPYNISFGNRVATQIEHFVNIYCSCFTMSDALIHDAVETILLSKVVSKLELKSIENKEELAAEFDKLNFRKCGEFIRKINEV